MLGPLPATKYSSSRNLKFEVHMTQKCLNIHDPAHEAYAWC